MELKEYLAKFIPDYEVKLETASNKAIDKMDAIIKGELSEDYLLAACLVFELLEDNFSESIQSFADNICDRQRANCAESVGKRYFDASGCIFEQIHAAPQPEISEL